MPEIPEEIICNECGLYSAPNVEESNRWIVLKCFWCEAEFDKFSKTRFSFGKYNGKIISECEDLQYLIWVRDNIHSRPEIIEVVRERIKEIT